MKAKLDEIMTTLDEINNVLKTHNMTIVHFIAGDSLDLTIEEMDKDGGNE